MELFMLWLSRVGWSLTIPMAIALLMQSATVASVLLVVVGLIACTGLAVGVIMEALEYI